MDKFTDWLISGEQRPYYYHQNGWCNIIIRVEKNADFDYLYVNQQFSTYTLTREEDFKYVGVYCRRNGSLYDTNDYLFGTHMQTETTSAEALIAQLKDSVRQKVDSVIKNERSNLSISEITDDTLLKRLDFFRQYSANERARERVLNQDDYSPPVFNCEYVPEGWDEDTMLLYILNPDSYVEAEAKKYLAENQEYMLYQFLCNDAETMEYQAILADTTNPVHIIKKIMSSMRQAENAKTVNVTILKDGVEFSFKTEAFSLRCDCIHDYSTWQMIAADRRKFEELFGRYASYYPQEIVRITYARKILYDSEKQE